jgi:hypothetical protein
MAYYRSDHFNEGGSRLAPKYSIACARPASKWCSTSGLGTRGNATLSGEALMFRVVFGFTGLGLAAGTVSS